MSKSSTTAATLKGDGGFIPDITGLTGHAFAFKADNNSGGLTTAPTTGPVVTGFNAILKGDEKKGPQYKAMNTWYDDNRKAMKESCTTCEDTMQVGSFAFIFNIQTGKNSVTTGVGSGWGYMHPPVMETKELGASAYTPSAKSTSTTYSGGDSGTTTCNYSDASYTQPTFDITGGNDTTPSASAGMTACLPVNWDKYTSLSTTSAANYAANSSTGSGAPGFTACTSTTKTGWGLPVWWSSNGGTPTLPTGCTLGTTAGAAACKCTGTTPAYPAFTASTLKSGMMMLFDTVTSDADIQSITANSGGFGTNANKFSTYSSVKP
jgi:hypothetical protein